MNLLLQEAVIVRTPPTVREIARPVGNATNGYSLFKARGVCNLRSLNVKRPLATLHTGERCLCKRWQPCKRLHNNEGPLGMLRTGAHYSSNRGNN